MSKLLFLFQILITLIRLFEFIKTRFFIKVLILLDRSRRLDFKTEGKLTLLNVTLFIYKVMVWHKKTYKVHIDHFKDIVHYCFLDFIVFLCLKAPVPIYFTCITFFFLCLISPFVFHGRKYVVWVCNTMRVSKRWQNFQFFCELVLRLLVDTCHPTCTQIYAHVSNACIICFSVSFPFISRLIFLRHPPELLFLLIMSFFSFLQYFLLIFLPCSFCLFAQPCALDYVSVRGVNVVVVSARELVYLHAFV